MVLLRYLKGWDQATLAQAARTAPTQISEYHRRHRTVPRKVLERIAQGVGFPTYLLDPLLRELRLFVVASRAKSRGSA
jgi:transcriptional regulator with XRE-family HTH domain